MAWLSDLAGKAETLLNKIDQNTAAVLSKEKSDLDGHNQLTGVTWTPSRGSSSIVASRLPTESPIYRPQSNVTARGGVDTPLRMGDKDDEFISFLNAPPSTPIKRYTNDSISCLTPSSLIVEHSLDTTKDSISEYSVDSSRSSPGLAPQSLIVDVPDDASDGNDSLIINDEYPSDVYKENKRLCRKVEELENELLVANHVEKSIESEHSDMQQKIGVMKQEYEYKILQQRLEIEHLTRNKYSDNKRLSKRVYKNLEEQNESLSRQHTDGQKEIEMLKEKIHLQELETAQYLKQITDLTVSLDRNRLDLQSTRQELEQHRARALKTLQEKEKLIAELLDNNTPVGLEGPNMELNQLRQECSALREENQHVCEQLKSSREELAHADLKIEETSRRIAQANREAHEIILNERKKRVEAEEDLQTQLAEICALKDKLSSQHNNWSIKLRKEEAEISRLRSQLAAISTPSSAVELRLSALTQTLVAKQHELETLTTEKNALRLQLEKIEHEYRKLLGNSRKPYNVNDTDDAKAQVPAFFMETPFDTGVTRRVKRAYTSLDAVGIRIGFFLRRYPLARIFVLIYIGLLHFWVLIVLLFQSPDIHDE